MKAKAPTPKPANVKRPPAPPAPPPKPISKRPPLPPPTPYVPDKRPPLIPPPTVDYRHVAGAGIDPLRVVVVLTALVFFLVGVGVGSKL